MNKDEKLAHLISHVFFHFKRQLQITMGVYHFAKDQNITGAIHVDKFRKFFLSFSFFLYKYIIAMLTELKFFKIDISCLECARQASKSCAKKTRSFHKISEK